MGGSGLLVAAVAVECFPLRTLFHVVMASIHSSVTTQLAAAFTHPVGSSQALLHQGSQNCAMHCAPKCLLITHCPWPNHVQHINAHGQTWDAASSDV